MFSIDAVFPLDIFHPAWLESEYSEAWLGIRSVLERGRECRRLFSVCWVVSSSIRERTAGLGQAEGLWEDTKDPE